MNATTRWLEPRAGLMLVGLSLALALRLAVAGNDGVRSVPAGLVFAAALMILVVVARYPSPPAPRPLRERGLGGEGYGIFGAAVLVAMPLLFRLSHPVVVGFPIHSFPVWAIVVSVVAVAEELLLRGVLFTMIEAACGPFVAVAATAAVFGLLHVPLYGWSALPVDLAVGVWLGGLRVVSGSVAAPAIAHTLADLAAWWVV